MSWRDQAACTGRSDVDWFPEGSAARSRSKAAVQNLARARSICDGCPVKADCLVDALEVGAEQHGIRAGLTEEERYPLARRPANRRLQPIRHGTSGGFQQHRYRGEQPCDPCRLAHNDSKSQRRRERKERAS